MTTRSYLLIFFVLTASTAKTFYMKTADAKQSVYIDGLRVEGRKVNFVTAP